MIIKILTSLAFSTGIAFGTSINTSEAAILQFTGSDADGSLTNAQNAFASFRAAAASSLTTLDFESQSTGTFSALNLPEATITAPGVNGSFDVFGSPAAGAFATSGSKYIGNNFATNSIQLTFDNPIRAFSVFITDNDSENITISFNNGSSQEFVVPVSNSNGSDAFFGFVDTASSTSVVTLSDNGLFVGYDDISFAAVPEPNPSLLTFGLAGISFVIKSRFKKAL